MLANDISSWECILWRKDGKCRATVKISPTDKFIEHVNDHTHAPSPTQVEVTKIKVGMKHKAKTTEATVQEILGEQLGNISADAAANLPSISTMRQNIRKAREDGNIPQIREGVPVLPNEYQLTKSGEPFSMFDSGEGNPESMFIFLFSCLFYVAHLHLSGSQKHCKIAVLRLSNWVSIGKATF